jgi:hypothetical protein
LFTLFVVVLTIITFFLLPIFIDGLIKLHKQEEVEKKDIIREGMEGYLDKIFGYGMAKMFKSIPDAEGNIRQVVYLPQYEWFKSPKYQWFEVYATADGYEHMEIER